MGTIGFSAVAGGVGAELTGSAFWKGATKGAIVAGLNYMVNHELGPKLLLLDV